MRILYIFFTLRLPVSLFVCNFLRQKSYKLKSLIFLKTGCFQSEIGLERGLSPYIYYARTMNIYGVIAYFIFVLLSLRSAFGVRALFSPYFTP